MLVIHINQRDDAATGGAVRVSYEQVKRLGAHGIDARMVFLYGGEGPFGRAGVRREYLHIPSSRSIFALFRLANYLRRVKPDIVHFHDDLPWPQLANFFQRRWVTVVHAHADGVRQPKELKIKLMYMALRRHADRVLCITDNTLQQQALNVGYTGAQLRICRNGVDIRRFSPVDAREKARLRRALGLPVEARIVGFVGRLHNEMKGCLDFIEIFRHLPDDVRGVVAGTGPDDELMRRAAVESGVAERLSFVGLIEDVDVVFKSIDVFCFTSKHEPFGLTIAEAMAANVPVVGFSCPGGSGELLCEETGQVIPERDVKAMASAIVCALEQGVEVQRRMRNALALLEKNHDWDKIAANLAQEYGSLIEGRRAASGTAQ